MATPVSTTSHEGGKPAQEQPTFRFCSECSNMLYPKEDEDAHRLQYTCRTCQYTEEATSTCVYRNELNTQAGETAGVTQDVGSDPTVGTSQAPATCLLCGCAIMCAYCSMPASPTLLTFTIGRDDASEGNTSNSVFSTTYFDLDDDPFAEYDEEMEFEDVFSTCEKSDNNPMGSQQHVAVV
jgi:DNA-directed RNA polymerase II subunit RPB9